MDDIEDAAAAHSLAKQQQVHKLHECQQNAAALELPTM